MSFFSQNEKEALAQHVVPPPPEPLYVPKQVTPRQARLALLGAGLLDQVESAVNARVGAQKARLKIEWEYSTSIERSSPWIASLGAALSLTSDQLDQLFIQAETL